MSRPGLMAVDIGNSAVKLGWFPPGEAGHGVAAAPLTHGLPQPQWTEQYATAEAPPGSLRSHLIADPMNWYVSSVHREGAARLQNWVEANRPTDALHVLSYRDMPIELRVRSPERLGLDRLAAAVAANSLRRSGHAALVVGSGTAVTVNLLGTDGAFEGGAILPGFRMQAQALYGADQLPLTDFAADESPLPLGKDTEQAIRSGLFWGTVGAVRELLTRLTEQVQAPVDLFVTGGDVRRLAVALGGDAQFVPNMVLAGVAIAACQRRS